MDKNTAWAIGLSTVVIVGSLFIQTKFFPPAPQSTTAENTNSQDIANSMDSQSSSVHFFKAEENAIEKAEEFTIETNKARITFTNVGGDIIGYELLGEKEKDIDRPFDNGGKTDYRGVEMADGISERNRAFALSFGNSKSPIISDLFTTKRIDDYTIGFYRTFNTIDEAGDERQFTLAKTYSFLPDEYMFKLEVNLYGADGEAANLNVDGISYSLRTSPQIGPHFDPKQNRYEYRRFMAYTKNGKVKNTSLGNNQLKEFDRDFTWAGAAGKYFEILAIPASLDAMESLHYSTAVDSGYANAQIILSRKPVGEDTTDTYYIYAGPRNEKDLVKYNAAENNGWKLSGLKLNESSASSWLAWIEVVLKFILELINKLVNNWGVSIIIMTIIIKAAMFPLTSKSSLSTLKMQELQPKMQALQKKYEGNQQKLQEEMAKLYKESGYNPMSGCAPLILQMIIILALYQLFNNYFEFRGAVFIRGWISDLSLGDSVLQFKNTLPILNWNHLRILPFVYVITQLIYGYISQSTNPQAQAGNAQQQQQMKMMMYGMPVLFFFMFYNAPSGLLIYWTTSNIIQMIQQVIINRMIAQKKAEMMKKASNLQIRGGKKNR